MTSNNNTNNLDEYIDYSCSTPIERLARDVETILRKWHVDNGSDRHVSSTHNNAPQHSSYHHQEELDHMMSSTTMQHQQQNPQMYQIPHHNKSITSHPLDSARGGTLNSSSLGGLGLSRNTTRPPTSDDGGLLQSIRTEQLSWTISFSNSKERQQYERSGGRGTTIGDHIVSVSEQIDLELVLWDGPISSNQIDQEYVVVAGQHSKNNSNNSNKNNANKNQKEMIDENTSTAGTTSGSVLPYSVQVGRNKNVTTTALHSEPQDNTIFNRHKNSYTNEYYYWYGMPSIDLFHNFSSMFGIGQHITLSPINPNYIPNGWWVQQQQHQNTQYHHNSSSGNGSSRSSLLLRHDPNHIVPELLQRLLTSQLQTAINLAATSCQCCFPVFGIWGHYQPQLQLQQHQISSRNNSTSSNGSSNIQGPGGTCASSNRSAWMTHPRLSVLEGVLYPNGQSHSRRKKSGRRRRGDRRLWNTSTLPPILLGRVTSPDCIGRFQCSIIPEACVWSVVADLHRNNINSSNGNSNLDISTPAMWPLWRYILQRHMWATSTSRDTAVYLWGARHVYSWFKDNDDTRSFPDQLLAAFHLNRPQSDWRKQSQARGNSTALNNLHHRGVVRSLNNDTYRRECRQVALYLLEQAAGATERDPLWGPVGDPVISMQAILTWNGKSPSNNVSAAVEPLVCLPVESRSKMSNKDWLEMVENMESTILDPERASIFKLKVFYDHEMAQVSLAATQHCILAALIRAVTLPRQTPLSHLTNDQTMLGWNSMAGDHVADALCTRANVGETTRSLVAAMDWTGMAESIISHRQAEEIVREVFNGRSSLMFPLASEDFAVAGRRVWKPLLKAARPARLLSLLFVRMGGVRSPPSMALIWDCFVRELRRRWEFRESIPNMNTVPALDPLPIMNRAQANLAAYVNSTEPDPDDSYCLIGQKLQVRWYLRCLDNENTAPFTQIVNQLVSYCEKVFNLCLELVVTSESRDELQLEKRPKLNDENDDFEFRPTAVTRTRTLMNGSIVNGLPKVDYSHREHSDDDGRESNIEFFDAEEGTESTANGIHGRGVTFHSDPRRIGARCPVQGLNMTETGDQLYAPFLQRPYPITDDVIAERRGMIARQTGKKTSTTVRQRLEVTQRIRKPKLLSDMRAFKAANHGCVFQDFIQWYGNPDNLVESYDDGMDQSSLLDVGLTDDLATQLDRAAESIRILDATREFWSNTWETADPVPAIEQEALFDPNSVAEMALDYLETLHPSSLLCQVVSVNLAMAYFALVTSAEDLVLLDKIKGTILQTREKVESALQLLAKDASSGVAILAERDRALPDGEKFDRTSTGDPFASAVSIESISACERACVALGEAEVLVSRATSLISKVPNGYDLVQRIMTTSEGTEIDIMGKATRNNILSSIEGSRGPGANSTSTNNRLCPSVREYLLRNSDDNNPCQLSVQYGGQGNGLTVGGIENDVFLALTTTELL